MTVDYCVSGVLWTVALACITIVISAADSVCLAATTSPAPVTDEVRLKVVHRLLNLRNVDVEYDLVKDYTPSQKSLELLAKHGIKHAYVGRYYSSGRFSFLDGSARYETENSPQTLAREMTETGGQEELSNIFISTPKRCEALTRWPGPSLVGGISNPGDQDLPDRDGIDTALGLRAGSPKATWLDSKALEQARIEPDPDVADQVKLTIPFRDGLQNSWWLRITGDDIAIPKYTYASANGEVYWQVDCTDFSKNEDGVPLPHKVVARTFYHGLNETAYCNETMTITVRTYNNKKDNTPDRYLMVWPLGANVTDQRTKQNFHIGSGPRTLDDDFLNAAAAKARQPVER